MKRDRGIILLLGGPGAGKGTQGRLLSEKLGVSHISSGELVRTKRTNHPEDSVSRGELLPDAEVAKLVFERLAQPDAAHGAILDGFPRTLRQVQQLDEWLRQRGGEPPIALYIDVPTDELLARLSGRSSASGRSDDNPEAATRRLELFASEMPAVLDAYERRGALLRVNGLGPVDVVHQRLIDALH